MRLVLTLSMLLSVGTTFSGCCPLSCLIAGSKDSSTTKQVTPAQSSKGDKNPSKTGEKSKEQP